MKDTDTCVNGPAASAAHSYREWPDCSADGAVRCWWEQRVSSRGSSHVQRVLPDGCSDILVFDAGEAVVVGPTLKVALPRLAPGTRVRGLRLRSEALAAVLGVPGSQVRDLTVPLGSVLPRNAAASVAEAVWQREFPALLRQVVVDERVRHAVRRAFALCERTAVVADEIGLSERQLRRLLHQHTGLGPSSLRRVGRLQRFVRLADRAWPGLPLADLAIRCGYADQSHLTREVQDLAGATPTALLLERSRLDGRQAVADARTHEGWRDVVHR